MENIPNYGIEYQAHVQNIGWQDWVEEGKIAGTIGKGYRLEALRIRMVKLTGVKMNLETPTANQNVKNSINVAGWMMMDNPNADIEVYIDNTKMTETLNRTQRTDIINGVKGYGGAVLNPTPRYSMNIPTSGLSDGSHIVKVNVVDTTTGEILESKSNKLIIKKYGGILYMDNPTTQDHILFGNILQADK